MSQSDPAVKLSRAEELNAIGAKFFAQGQLEPARLHFLAALSLEPNQASALQNLGATLRNLNHYPASEVVAKRSVAVTEGKNPYCRSNLGVAQLGLKKYSESLTTLQGVLDDLPDSAPSWHNYGLALYMTGQYGAALVAFEKSLSLNYNVQAASDRSLTLLALGEIQKGLESYEVRWEILHKNRIWTLGIPEWQGEALDGRRILLHHEQGFGDSIMLVRFIKALAKYKCQITLAVPEPLRRLFQRNFPFIKVITVEDESLDETKSFDYHSPLLSLMRWTGVDRPKDISAEPYLSAKPEPPMKLPSAKYKIGLCWASGNHSPALMDRRRLVPLTLFLPLLEDGDMSIISLQKGEDVKDIVANGLEGLIFDVSPKLEDFADTANTIAALDLVISVDSAVAHLAGALGKPCLMLSPYTRCWRWWGGAMGWPWYSRMKIFSQSQSGSWSEAAQQVVRQAKWILKQA